MLLNGTVCMYIIIHMHFICMYLRFDIAESTAHEVVGEFCRYVIYRLKNLCVKFPTMASVDPHCGIPGVVGYIDGKHNS